jgi:PAS domain S-box-containing protein
MSDPHRSPAEPGGEPLEPEADQNLLIQQAINAILRMSLEPISLEEQMHRVLDLILQLPWLALQAQGCIFLVDDDAQELVLKAHVGMAAGVLSTCSRVGFGTCLCGRALADHEIVFARGVDECHTTLYPGMQPHGHYCVPIGSAERWVGLLNLYVREGHQRSPVEERFLRAVADVLAGIIERQRTQERFQEQLRLAAFGRDVGLALSQSDRLPDMLRQCAEAMVRHLDGAFARIWALNEAEGVLELQASAGLYTHLDGAHRRVPVGQYKIGLIAQERKPHLTNAVFTDPRVHDQAWARREGLVAFAGYPLLVEDRLVGVMALFARSPLSSATLDAMASVANGIAVGMERKRTQERLLEQISQRQHAYRRMAAEHSVSRILAESTTLNDAAARILPAICDNLDWEVGAVWVVDRNAKVLRCIQTGHKPGIQVAAFEEDTRQRTFAPSVGLPGRIWASEQLVWVANVNEEVNLPRAPLAAALRLRGAVGFPIHQGNECIGVIEFFGRAIRQPDNHLIDMMTSLGLQISQFIERKQAEQQAATAHAVSRILADASTIDEAAPKIVRVLGENLDWDVGAFWLPDLDAQVLQCVDFWHKVGVEVAAFEAVTRQQAVPPGVDLPGRVWASHALAWIGDVQGSAPFPRKQMAAHGGLHGAVGVPIWDGVHTQGVLEFFSRAIREPDNRLIELMTSIGIQIGQFIQRKLAELRVRLEETKLAALLEASSDAVLLSNLDGQIVQVNSQLERVFGYSRHELFGQPVEMLMPERFRSQHIQQRAAYAVHPRARPMGAGLELFGWRKNGEEFPVDIGLAPIPSSEGVVIATVIRDLSAPRQWEPRLGQSQGELEETADWTKLPAELANQPASSVVSLAVLVDALRQYRLLQAAQLEQVERNLQSQFPDPPALVQELIERNWLTAYQASKLLQGTGQELLLGEYIVLERLGLGGSGQVFKVRHRDLGSTVAIKLLRKELVHDRNALKRHQRELQAARLLDHPNILRTLDVEEVASANMLVMEYTEGATDLAKIVAQEGPLPVAQACDLIRQAALGLQHAHERGVVHRDIKPSNLLLLPGSVVKILDMGLALFTQTPESSTAACLGQERVVMGTPNYMAPEQALEPQTVDIRADLYSLGCTFYFLLTGQVPFPEGPLVKKLRKHRQEEPPSVESIRPDVPSGVLAIVRRLMAKRAEDRYQTPAEVVAVLTAVLSAVSGPGRAEEGERTVPANRS